MSGTNPTWALTTSAPDFYKSIEDPVKLARLWAEFEQLMWQRRSRATPATIEPVVFSVHHIYANNIFDAAFMRSSRLQ